MDTSALNPAGVIRVASSGGDYTTVEAALAVAVSGQMVLVYPGTYTVPEAGYGVPAGVVLQGVSRDLVVFDATAGAASTGAVLLQGNGAALGGVHIQVENTAAGPTPYFACIAGAFTGLEISSIRVSGSGAFDNAGIDVLGTVTIQDVELATSMTYGITLKWTDFAGSAVARVSSLRTADGITVTQLVATGSSGGCTLWLSDVQANLAGGGLLSTGGGPNQFAYLNGITAPGASIGLTAAVNPGHDPTLSCFSVEAGALSTTANQACNLTIDGSYFTSVSIPSASASSVLPDRSGTAVILSGASAVNVAAATVGGAGYDGKPAFFSLNETDGVLYPLRATWNGSGQLTLTLSGATTADRTVAWSVEG